MRHRPHAVAVLPGSSLIAASAMAEHNRFIAMPYGPGGGFDLVVRALALY